MKYLIFSLCVVICLSGTSANIPADYCKCSQIQYQADCQAASMTVNGVQMKCVWTSNGATTGVRGTCALTAIATKALTYCSTQTPYKCPSIIGCALPDGVNCMPFSGCTSYVMKTDIQCQAISEQCTTNGTNCVLTQACTTMSVADCLTHTSNSGSGTCKISNNTCIDQVCSDASTDYISDLECGNFITGCVTIGIGCATQLSPCSSYLGNAQTYIMNLQNSCKMMRGSDGSCKYVSGSYCTLQNCEDSPLTITKNTDCALIIPQCPLTNNRGCVVTYPSCTTYLQSYGACSTQTGIEGTCIAATNSAYCRARVCSDNTVAISDSSCNTYLAGCVTTGQGCTTSPLGPCSSLKGTTTTCLNYTGSDGNCKGTSATDATQPCALKLCSDAPSTYSSNSVCASWQKGCLTNGIGCTNNLGLCSSMSSTATNPCTNYIGSDGACVASAGTTQCSSKVCNQGLYTTNQACISFSPVCISNGTNCILPPSTCDLAPSQTACTGMSGCLLTNVCLNASSCANYMTYNVCMVNSAGYPVRRKCVWQNSCTDQLCSSLTGSQFTADYVCQDPTNGLLGCLYSGNPAAPCVEANASCSLFFGDNTAPTTASSCGRFTPSNIANCWGVSATPAACRNRVCYDYIRTVNPTTDAMCNAFLKGCVSDGNQGCTPAKQNCASQQTDGNGNLQNGYNGTDAQCQAITAADGRCYPQTPGQTSGPCKLKTCDYCIAAAGAMTALQCSNCLAGCTTNFNTNNSSAQCIRTDTACNTQALSYANCLALGLDYKCSKYSNFCKTLTVGPCGSYTALGATIQVQAVYCQNLKNASGVGCAANGTAKCVELTAITSCSQFYVGTTSQYATCAKFSIAGTNCGYASGNTCGTFQCSQITPIQNSSTCISNLISCAYASGPTCLTKQTLCTGYSIPATLTTSALKIAYCQSIVDNVPNYCTYVSAATCVAKKCEDITNVTLTTLASQSDCDAYVVGCVYTPWQCVTKQVSGSPTCVNYVFPNLIITSDSQKQQYCNMLKDPTDATKYCTYNGAAITTSCSAAGTPTCATYAAIGTTSTDKQAFCSSLFNSDGLKYCTYTSGGFCAVQTGVACTSQVVTAGLNFANSLYCLRMWSSTVQCAYSSGGTCQNVPACASLTLPPSLTEHNYKYLCSRISGCYYQQGIMTPVCKSTYACEDIVNTAQSQEYCTNYKSGCIWNNSTACYTQTAACTGILGKSLTYCLTVQDLSGNYCTWSSGSQCKVRVCSDVQTPLSQSDCDNYMWKKCQFNSQNCQPIQVSCSSYTYTGSMTVGITACYMLSDSTGNQCYVDTSNPGKCKVADCTMAPQSSVSNCASFIPNCIENTTSYCSNQVCTDNTTATTDDQCGDACVTNGQGCIAASSDCDSFKGIDSTCRGFTAYNGLHSCYQLTTVTDPNTPCIVLTCALNTTATSDTQCETWFPSPAYSTPATNFNCVWNGTTGCVAAPVSCSSFQGTILTCPTFNAQNDGPCKGASLSVGACSPAVCSDAPATAVTDAICNAFKKGCVTTGAGCAAFTTANNFVTMNACIAGGNLWASTCIKIPASCIIISTATECVNAQIAKSTANPSGTCAWGGTVCRNPICTDLPTTTTTDSACSSLLSTCTTSGAGCVTKGACSSYTPYGPTTCAAAANTEVSSKVSKCIWDTVQAVCRTVICEDNATATTQTACNSNGLTNCIYNGATCLTAPVTCSQFISQATCLIDGFNTTCLWLQGACVKFTKCQDLTYTTHAACYAVTSCTSNGTSCIPLDQCANYTAKQSCNIANDGSLCGLLPSGKCQKFVACTDALGTTNTDCQNYNPSCYSDGTSCLILKTCSSYLTQQACSNNGTDGICVWDSNACRQQKCTDGKFATDAACATFPAPLINTCTTNGTNCIARQTCSQYTTQDSCVMGTNGACIWSSSLCRAKVCTDVVQTTTALCQNAIISNPGNATTAATYLSCVSNGTNCISKSTCATYTNRLSCNSGGTDGICAYVVKGSTTTNSTSSTGTSNSTGTGNSTSTTNSTGTSNSTATNNSTGTSNSTNNSTTNNSTSTNSTSTNTTTTTNTTTATTTTTNANSSYVCQLTTQCQDATGDPIACAQMSNTCQLATVNSGNVSTTSCVPLNCLTGMKNKTCQPITSFSQSSISFCVSTNGSCAIGDATKLKASTCFSQTAGTYTWNDTSSACSYCGVVVNTTNSTNTTNTSTTNTTSNNTPNASSSWSPNQMAFLVYGMLLIQ